MKTLVLDSSPGIHIKDLENIPVNVSPVYKSRGKGQPLLGQKQPNFGHFVILGSNPEKVKELLKIPESEILDAEPLKGSSELLKAEKIAAMKDRPVKSKLAPFYDAEFVQSAQEYVREPQLYRESSYPQKTQLAQTKITEKNDAEVANIIAAARPPIKSTANPKFKPKMTPRSKTKPQKKKIAPSTTSMKSFRVVGRNKK